MSKYNTHDAINFMNGIAPDSEGRTINDYWNLSLDEWESCHNHIQWAFPSNIPSEFNSHAPVVNMDEYIHGLDINGRYNQKWLINHYLISLGIVNELVTTHCNPELLKELKTRNSNYWLVPHNHNYRRLTRLLNLLYYFSTERGNWLLNCLEVIRREANRHDNFGCINNDTILYWRLANRGKLHEYV